MLLFILSQLLTLCRNFQSLQWRFFSLPLQICLLTACAGCANDPKELGSIESAVDQQVACVAYSSDGKFMAAGMQRTPLRDTDSRDGEVKVWDANTLAEVVAIRQDQWVTGLAFSPDGKWLAIACGGFEDSAEMDGQRKPAQVSLFDCSTYKDTARFQLKGGVYAIAFSPDSQSLAAAGGGDSDRPGEVKLWSVTTFKEIAKLREFHSICHAVAFSPDGKTLAVGGMVRKLRQAIPQALVHLYDTKSGDKRSTLEVQPGSVDALAFFADGQTLVVYAHPLVKLWDVTSGQEKEAIGLSGGYTGTVGLSVSSDGKRLAISSSLGGSSNYATLHLWDIQKAKMETTWKVSRVRYRSLAFSPDSKTLVAGGTDGVKLWSLPY